MDVIYSGIMIDASEELAEGVKSIAMYTESVMKTLDMLEENRLIKAMYFTESKDDSTDDKSNDKNNEKEDDKSSDKKSTTDKDEKGIIGKIGEAISTIFHKIISLFTRGKTSAKGVAQANGLKKISGRVKKYGNVKVKIQDVWSFGRFADKAIDEYTKGFDKKIVEILNRVKGKDKAIKVLTENLNKLASAMRSPANRRFTVAKEKSVGHKVGKGVGLAAATGAVVAVNTTAAFVGSTLLSKGDPNKFSKINARAATVNLAALVGAVALFFHECPTSIGSETITIQELYNRLVELKPETFPSIAANRAKSVSNYMQREDSLRYFKDASDGSKSSVKFSEEMAELLTAYTNFHQSMIDYYFSIILTVIEEENPTSSVDKPVKPKKVVSVPNDENT